MFFWGVEMKLWIDALLIALYAALVADGTFEIVLFSHTAHAYVACRGIYIWRKLPDGLHFFKLFFLVTGVAILAYFI